MPEGNFHSFVLFKTDEELDKVSQCVHRLVKRAIALDGTCKLLLCTFFTPAYLTEFVLKGTGEHGVGVGKKEYLVSELGEGTVNLMKAVKDAIDPNHIMNPGKVHIDSMLVVRIPLIILTGIYFQLYPDETDLPGQEGHKA